MISIAGNDKEEVFAPINNDTLIYGNLQVTKLLEKTTEGSYYHWIILASFQNYLDSDNVVVGSVKYDSIELKFKPELGNVYNDTSGNFPSVGKLWEVTGNGILPSFTCNSADAEPYYSGFNDLPDSVVAGASLPITLMGVTNATNVSIQISDGFNATINQDIYLSSSPIARGTYDSNYGNLGINFEFDPDKTTQLSATQNGFLQVIVSYLSIIEVDGKKFAITNMFLYRKNNFIIY